MTNKFTHLQVHSEYSIVNGMVRISDLIQKTVELGMSSVALTDHVNLFALVKFYKAAVKNGIKPIVGADISWRNETGVYQVTLLCKNQQGYKNLTELLSRAYLEGQGSGKPIVEWQWIVEKSEGLIALSGGKSGDVGQAIIKGHDDQAIEAIKRWERYFPDAFYLTLQRTKRPQEEVYLKKAIELAEQTQTPVVASNAVCFMKPTDFGAHEARTCVQTGNVLDDSKRPRLYSEQQYFKSPQEMESLFADIPEALENSIEIAKRCTVKLTLGEVFLPNFPVPEGVTVDDFFIQESEKGLQQRLTQLKITDPELIKPYKARLKRELDVIIEMGFPGYFLIVADFISWSKRNDIPVGPGRGSGAGSLVAYSLGITELDPLKHDLLFERFLNPERVSMPDFDVDFCMEGRDRVIEYVADRYGHDAVAQIITYGTMAAKAVVRDVGRVLSMPYGYVDKIAKLVPFELGMTLEKALIQESRLKEMYDNEEPVTTLIDLALKLEGITRNAGKHAGGVVIAPTKLTDFVPIYCEENGGSIVTQFDKDDIETIGLVKFDFLGLRTLTIINWAIKNINLKRAKLNEPLLDIQQIPTDDKLTFDLLKRNATTAVFQLESRGMKDLIRRLQPDSFDEITALVALFRPGPLQSGMVDDFIDRKHGKAKVEYPHPDLKPILESTYGVILYQEQVMKIAQVLAGYSLGGADILRRAMGKKKPEEMAKQREIFTDGATKRGIDRKLAEGIFDLMEKFAAYGFNKSHSAAYALIAYQTAWLKAHYPAEFMAAVLSSDMDNTDKVVSFLEECKRMKLKVIPPNVNRGFYKFTVNKDDEIEYGLGAVKGVGEAVINHLVEERNTDGDYKNLFNFCERLHIHKLSRRALEPLIRSGAMDGFEQPRSILHASTNRALKAADQKQKDAARGQDDLFGDLPEASAPVEYAKAKAWNINEILQGEKNSLGWYLSGHPYSVCEAELEKLVTGKINTLRPNDSVSMVVGGVLIGMRPITTKKGKRMAIMGIEDQTGRLDVTLFSDVLLKYQDEIASNSIFVVKGKISHDDYSGGVRMVAEAVMSLRQVREKLSKRLRISVNTQEQVDRILSELPSVIRDNAKGRTPVTISYQADSAATELKLGDEWKVRPSDALLQLLHELCGRDNVVLEY